MVLSIHKNSQIPILSGIDRLSYITILLVLIKIQWEIEIKSLAKAEYGGRFSTIVQELNTLAYDLAQEI